MLKVKGMKQFCSVLPYSCPLSSFVSLRYDSFLRLLFLSLFPLMASVRVCACVLHEIHMSSPAVVRAGALFRSLSVLCVSPVPILFVLLLLLLLFFFVRTLHVVSQRE